MSKYRLASFKLKPVTPIANKNFVEPFVDVVKYDGSY
jgi:hypothetical protein